MTRRVLLSLLAFTVAVIVGAGVPLALYTISHEQESFTQATVAAARTYAEILQPRLTAIDAENGNISAARSDSRVLTLFEDARESGDGLYVQAGGKMLDQAGMPPGNWAQLAIGAQIQARQASQPQQQGGPVIIGSTGSWQIAALAVRGTAGTPVGAVILARSTNPLDHSIFVLWVILGTIAVFAMLVATLLAFGLARWVSRPLKGLDGAARRLADGDLAIRAEVGSGPPELRRLGTTFNTMAGRLEALVHGSRAVLADVSHQLRTPLAALRLRLDLLASDSDPDTARELAAALEELARLSRLVDGLLAVARAENVVPVPIAVDIAEVAAERVEAWHPVADDRGIALQATPGPPVLAWIGEGHLEQVIDNLIANALDALGPGQRVVVTTAATPGGARIVVRDNGPGMTAEERERAFLRFSTNNPNGTGLGLAIVHRLVTSNGGTAGLAESPGGGLTVTLDFPGAANSGSASAPAPAAATL